MANAVKARAALDLVEANLARWNQFHLVSGEVNPVAQTVNECGASFCYFGWVAVAEGYLPVVNENGDPCGEFHNPTTGDIDYAESIARRALEVNDHEANAIYGFMTRDFAELKDRVESVIAGEWR